MPVSQRRASNSCATVQANLACILLSRFITGGAAAPVVQNVGRLLRKGLRTTRLEVALPLKPRLPHVPKTIRGNMGPLFVRSLLVGLRINVLTVILQPFVLALGGSVAFLGLLETLGGYRGLVPTLIQPGAGWLADRVGRKSLGMIAGGVTVFSLLLYAAAGRLGAVALLLPATVLVGLNAIGRPAMDALVVESVGSERVGWAYSLVSFGWAAAGVVASLGAGLLADRLGYAPVFVITAILEMVGLGFLALGVRETLVRRQQARLGPHEVRHLTLGWMAPPPSLRVFYLAVTIDSFFYGIGSALLYGFLADRYGYTPFQFGVMTTLYSVTWMLAQLPAGRWADRGRVKDLLVIAEGLNAVVIASWLLTQQFAAIAISMALLGVVGALWSPALIAWIYARVPGEERAEEMGRLSALPGLFAIPAPWLGGLLYERLGFAAPIGLNLIGALMAMAILAWGLGRERRGYDNG